MYENEFFVVDMASCSSTGEIINSLSLALETLNHSGQKLVLKLNNNRLNQSQLLSIQSLITSYGCILDTIETINTETAAVAENMNILVQKPIENRVEERYGSVSKTDNLQEFSTFTKEPIMKEIDDTHFEANLEALKHEQDSIDVKSELYNAGISPSSDFETIQKQLDMKYSFTEPVAVEKVENILTDSSSLHSDTDNKITNTKFDNKQNETEFQDVEKNSIGVYRQAYPQDDISEEHWENVDFYETPTSDPVVSDSKNTTYINQTLRSGQILESEGNVVIIGDCHPGSEIRAVGDITVWGILSGIAHAGYKGNLNSKIRALKLNAVQLRIGKCYSRRPDGTNIPYIIRSSIFTPEEARVVDGEIKLFKINQN